MSQSNSSAAATPAAAQAVVVDHQSVRSWKVDWLWEGRIALGKVTLLIGDPGLGKSLLTVDWAARVSRGRKWPDEAPNRAGSVLMASAEDDAEDTLFPRLEAAKADLRRVRVLTGVCDAGQEEVRQLSLHGDLAVLESALDALPNCRLLVIDPIAAFLGTGNGNSNHQVRTILDRLARLARRRNLAVVVVHHLNKREGGRALYRATGALAFVAATRSAWGVIRDPEAARLLLLPVKVNLTAGNLGLAFRIEESRSAGVAVVRWEDDVIERSIDELLGQTSRFNPSAQTYQDQATYAEDWLRQELSAGPQETFTLLSSAGDAQISRMQLHHASRKLNVIKTKSSFLSGWTWMLPEQFAGHPEREELLAQTLSAASEDADDEGEDGLPSGDVRPLRRHKRKKAKKEWNDE